MWVLVLAFLIPINVIYACPDDGDPGGVANSLMRDEAAAAPSIGDSSGGSITALHHSIVSHANRIKPPPTAVLEKHLPKLKGHKVEILETLGEGATSVVLLVQITTSEGIEVYVAKVSHTPTLLSDQKDLLHTLAESDFFPKVYDLTMYHEGLPTLYLEYIPGDTLYQKMSTVKFSNYRVKAQWIYRILLHMSELIEILESNNQSGQDLSARNVVIHNDTGKPVLIDTQNNSHAPLDSPKVLGTKGFIAPEILEGVAPSLTSDIYSLGRILFFLCFNKTPEDFEGDVPWESSGLRPFKSLFDATQSISPEDRPSLGVFRTELAKANDAISHQETLFTWQTGLVIDRNIIAQKLIDAGVINHLTDSDHWEMTIGRSRFDDTAYYVTYNEGQIVVFDRYLKLVKTDQPVSKDGKVSFKHFDLENGSLLSLSRNTPLIFDNTSLEPLKKMTPAEQEVRLRYMRIDSTIWTETPGRITLLINKQEIEFDGYFKQVYMNRGGQTLTYEFIASLKSGELVFFKFLKYVNGGIFKRIIGPKSPRVTFLSFGNHTSDIKNNGSLIY
jgi:serine/threonine protein kinase